MQRWKDFQRTAVVPAFRELRAQRVFATVQNLACCQSCGHGELERAHRSYVFFHQQDKDFYVKKGSYLYLAYDFHKHGAAGNQGKTNTAARRLFLGSLLYLPLLLGFMVRVLLFWVSVPGSGSQSRG